MTNSPVRPLKHRRPVWFVLGTRANAIVLGGQVQGEGSGLSRIGEGCV